MSDTLSHWEIKCVISEASKNPAVENGSWSSREAKCIVLEKRIDECVSDFNLMFLTCFVFQLL